MLDKLKVGVREETVRGTGYNTEDFDIQVFEFENCTHESVRPKG